MLEIYYKYRNECKNYSIFIKLGSFYEVKRIKDIIKVGVSFN